MASHIVVLDTVLIHVVQDGQAITVTLGLGSLEPLVGPGVSASRN
jgi:hypothetical protein